MDISSIKRKLQIFLTVVASITSGCLHAADHNESANIRENQLKAAFIYKIAKFVTWPEAKNNEDDTTQDEPFHFCIIDNQELSNILSATVHEKTIFQKSIKIKNIINGNPIDQCQVLYFHNLKPPASTYYLNEIDEKPILTIGNNENFISHGGIILLRKSRNRISFEINNSQAKKTGLNINAHLLRLSKVK